MTTTDDPLRAVSAHISDEGILAITWRNKTRTLLLCISAGDAESEEEASFMLRDSGNDHFNKIIDFKLSKGWPKELLAEIGEAKNE